MHGAMIPYAHEARAAMIYLHSTDDRQHKIADSLGDLARAEVQDDRERASVRNASGAQGARSPDDQVQQRRYAS